MIGKDQFEIQIGGVAQRIDSALGVGHAGIVENANHVSDGIDITQRGQAFAHAFFLHAGQIHILHGGVRDFLGVIQLGELQQPRLRNFRHSDVGGLRALGIHVRFGQDPKQRGFSNLW